MTPEGALQFLLLNGALVSLDEVECPSLEKFPERSVANSCPSRSEEQVRPRTFRVVNTANQKASTAGSAEAER